MTILQIQIRRIYQCHHIGRSGESGASDFLKALTTARRTAIARRSCPGYYAYEFLICNYEHMIA